MFLDKIPYSTLKLLNVSIFILLPHFIGDIKILGALGMHGFNQLSGIVESDETFFRESMKGREITHRKAKKRVKKDDKRGSSNQKIAVVVAQDRNGNSIARNAGTSRVKAEKIDAVIGGFIHHHLCYVQTLQPTI